MRVRRKFLVLNRRTFLFFVPGFVEINLCAIKINENRFLNFHKTFTFEYLIVFDARIGNDFGTNLTGFCAELNEPAALRTNRTLGQ